MADWEDPLQRAAVWFVAAYGALGAALLAGLSLANFRWSAARHPLPAVICVAVAVTAALVVVTLATGVLTPAYAIGDLVKRERQARATTPGSGWPAVAEDDEVLKPLVAQDGLAAEEYSPLSSMTIAEDAQQDANKRAEASARCDRLVKAANRREAADRFGHLRVITPGATGVILAAVVTWTSVSAPPDREASSAHPIAVALHLAPDQAWPAPLGPDCHAATLDAIALMGELDREPLVATEPADGCRPEVFRMTEQRGWVTAR